jgi:signal transduction histidine kinase
VILGAFSGHPHPATHGTGLGISLALLAFTAMMALALRDWFIRLGYPAQGAVIAMMGAAGIALSALQPHDATELAAGAAVWMAVARLPTRGGIALGVAITIGLDIAMILADSSSAAVIASTLLCALLGLIAHFMKQARESQDRTELLLAQLEDARDEQAQAAAVAERGRIAGELHDVLAHSLSGAAIQLQGARILAERGDAPPEVSQAIDRASELVRDGLSEARQAVGALRGEKLPGVDDLETLVAGYREDMHLDVELIIDGVVPALGAEASLALYRGAQEALTNVARYAPGARTEVRLCTAAARTVLTVEDHVTARPEADEAVGLTDVGGGRGLSAMRERLERIGGRASAGPTESGWRVELEVPA